MYFITACSVVFLVWYLLKYRKWRREILIPMEKLPGIKRYPIIGTYYFFFGIAIDDIFSSMVKIMHELPAVFRSWNGYVAELNVTKPEHLEIIMNNSIQITKGYIYNIISTWLGDGLLTSTGIKWHEHRKLITPTFHFKILENFMEIFVEKSKILLKQVEEKSGEKYFDIYSHINHCTLDIICESAMGVPINSMENNNSDYTNNIFRICNLMTWRMVRPYVYNNLIFKLFPEGREFQRRRKFLHDFSYKVIAERRELLEKQKKHVNDKPAKKPRLSFLDLLLEASNNGEVLSDQDIREEVDTFMFEGHDTTTAAISWTLFLLGNNEEVQNKVFLELQDVLGEKSMPTTLAELNQLKYLECVIKEALRLYPSVALISRTLTEEVYIDEYRIPSGVQAVLHIHKVHKDPEHYPEPEKFDPDRFLPENTVGRHAYAYIPFSAGPRNCIGQKFAMYEEKTILSSIIKKFKIKSALTPENIRVSLQLILRPVDGIVLKLIKRQEI